MGINHCRGILSKILSQTKEHTAPVSGAVTRHHIDIDSRLRGNDNMRSL